MVLRTDLEYGRSSLSDRDPGNHRTGGMTKRLLPWDETPQTPTSVERWLRHVPTPDSVVGRDQGAVVLVVPEFVSSFVNKSFSGVTDSAAPGVPREEGRPGDTWRRGTRLLRRRVGHSGSSTFLSPTSNPHRRTVGPFPSLVLVREGEDVGESSEVSRTGR